MIESGSTVSSCFGRSPNVQLISHFGSFVDDAPVETKLEILLSLSLIANRHVVKLLEHRWIINSYINAFTISRPNCECINVRKPFQLWTGVMWRKHLNKLWLTEGIKLLCHWNTWFVFNNSSSPVKTLRSNISLNVTVSLEHRLLWSTLSELPLLCFQLTHFWVWRKQSKHQNWSSNLTQKKKKNGLAASQSVLQRNVERKKY